MSRPSKERKIDEFYKAVNSSAARKLTAHSSTSGNECVNSDASTSTSTSAENAKTLLSSLDVPINDIGLAVGKKLTPEDKINFLEPWVPSRDEQFPSSVRKDRVGQRRRLLQNHLTQYPWLAVSMLHAGAFCTPCVLFGPSGVGGRSQGHGQISGALVTRPVKEFKKLTGKEGVLTKHERCRYHIDAQGAFNAFRKIYIEKRETDILCQLDKAHKKEVLQNRAYLIPIVDTILTCARQNIAFRGHRNEGGSVSADGAEPEENDGNFRALLRYRIRGGDEVLEKHVKTAKSNAIYQSADIQNQLIEVAGSLVTEKVASRAKAAKFWALIADETTDRQKRELLAVVLRYVHEKDGKWRCVEDPVAIVDLIKLAAADQDSGKEKMDGAMNDVLEEDIGIPFDDEQDSAVQEKLNEDVQKENQDLVVDEKNSVTEVRLTGSVIGEVLLNVVKGLGLDLTTCVGQGYDGAANLSSKRVGASAKILEEAENAHYFHCAMHCLNLCAAKTATVVATENAQSTINKVINYFKFSAKRTTLLKTVIANKGDTRERKKHLISLCKTRFVERHTAIQTFRSLVFFIVAALEQITQWQSLEDRNKAQLLLNSILQSSFVISMVVLEEVSSLLLPATRTLQAVGIDLVNAMRIIDDVVGVLKAMRNEGEFSKIFQSAEAIAETLNIVLAKPRIPIKRSMYRADCGGTDTSTEDYYRFNVFYPVIDAVLADLQLRFGDKQRRAMKLSRLIPSNMRKSWEADFDALQEGLNTYAGLLKDHYGSMMKAEYHLWHMKWSPVAMKDKPKTALAALDSCSDTYSGIQLLLQLLATLPVSTAQAERVFSKVEKTLSALRSSISEERCESLILLQMHRTDTPDVEDVITRFAVTKARRLRLAL